MLRQGWSLSIRWAMPWPMVACQEVPNGISSTEEKNINHLRRDKLSENNQSYMCTFNENEFLRLSKGVWNWTNSEGVFFSADIFKGQMIRVFKVAWKVFAINLGYQRAVFYHESRGNLIWKCNWQAGLYAEIVHLKKIVRRNLVIRRPIFYH